MLLVSQVHLKSYPFTGFSDDGHIPRPFNIVGELPQNMITILIRETLKIGLNNSFKSIPDFPVNGTNHIPPIILVCPIKYLKRINYFHARQVIRKPNCCRLWSFILYLFKELFYLFLPKGFRGNDVSFYNHYFCATLLTNNNLVPCVLRAFLNLNNSIL